MPFAAEWLYRRLGPHYFWAYAAFEVVTAWVTCAGTLGIFALYTPHLTAGQFLRAFVVSEAAVTLALVWTEKRAYRLTRPLLRWLRDGKPESGALLAWRAAAALPREFALESGWQAVM